MNSFFHLKKNLLHTDTIGFYFKSAKKSGGGELIPTFFLTFSPKSVIQR